MSGQKNKGHIIREESDSRYFDPRASDVNFAVPARDALGLNDETNVMPIVKDFVECVNAEKIVCNLRDHYQFDPYLEGELNVV